MNFWSLEQAPFEPGSINSLVLGDGKAPTFKRESLFHGYINRYYWVDEFIPYYMEMSWELIDPIAHLRGVH